MDLSEQRRMEDGISAQEQASGGAQKNGKQAMDRCIGLGVVLGLLSLLLIGLSQVHAETIIVTTTNDELNADGDCSLREAIQSANLNTSVDNCISGTGDDAITLPAGTYTLTKTGAGEDANVSGDLDLLGSLTITGDGAATTTIDGNHSDRVFDVFAGIVVVLDGVTITRGIGTPIPDITVNSGSGGINNRGTLTIINSTVEANTAFNAAGIGNLGNLIIEHSVLRANTATNSGGGIINIGTLTIINSTVSGNLAGEIGGGGIANGGILLVDRSAIVENEASGDGAGIWNGSIEADIIYIGETTVTNSTISDNLVANTARGGGIFNAAGTVTVESSTITHNTAPNTGGIYNEGGTLNLGNSIVASQAAGNDCFGTITSLGHNLYSDDSCNLTGSTDLPMTNPVLGSLANNGGPTKTHALLPGSPAIDAGKNGGCPVTDQRGIGRPRDGNDDGGANCDIGAVEIPTPFNVTVTADIRDNNPGDGVCETSGPGCTLRAAIEEANALAGPDVINIPAGEYLLSHIAAGSGLEDTLNAVEGMVEPDDGADIDIFGDVEINAETVGAVIINGGGFDRVFDIHNGNVTMKGLIITGGKTNGNGGGIRNLGSLTLMDSVISGNMTEGGINNGGGIYNGDFRLAFTDKRVTLVMVNSVVSGNTVECGLGGGIANIEGIVAITNSTIESNTVDFGHGGGILSIGPNLVFFLPCPPEALDNFGSNSTPLSDALVGANEGGSTETSAFGVGTLIVSNSTVSNNSVGLGGSGGGILQVSYPPSSVNVPFVLTNSTISGNSAGFVGGIDFVGDRLQIFNSTITGNNASDSEFVTGGISFFLSELGTLEITNSIIAGNSGPNLDSPTADCLASLYDPIVSSYNLMGTGTGCPNSGMGDLTVDPADVFTTVLDPNLTDNGGPTKTHALLGGSPAVEGGDPTGCADSDRNLLSIDQRGSFRPQDANLDGTPRCDIGAVERVPPTETVEDLLTTVEELPDSAFGSGGVGLQQAMLDKLTEALDDLNAGNVATAIALLEDLLKKVDGCPSPFDPDIPLSPQPNDWIEACVDQLPIRDIIQAILNDLST